MPDTDFVVVAHVQQVTDVTGQTQVQGDTSWFDCSVGTTPPRNEPCISVIKTANPQQVRVFDIVTYTYRVCNCGSVPLTVTGIVDTNTVIGSLLDEFAAANGGSDQLPVNACVQFTADYLVSATDPIPFFNCVTVTAEDDAGDEVDDTDCARVDIGPAPVFRQCFRPVTFTQELWHQFGETGNGLFQWGVLAGRFGQAFANHSAFGKPMANRLVMGDPTIRGGHTIVFEGSASGIARLCEFLPQIGPADKLSLNYHNPVCLDIVPGAGVTNRLAGEVCALTLNIALSDACCMPRSPGCELEKFTLLSGHFRGKTVGQVLNIANCVLGGVQPSCYGLPVVGGHEVLADILRGINSNYAFLGFDSFIDRGCLKPNGSLTSLSRPHQFVLPVP